MGSEAQGARAMMAAERKVRMDKFATLDVIDEHELMVRVVNMGSTLLAQCSCGEFEWTANHHGRATKEAAIDRFLKHVQQVRDALRQNGGLNHDA